MKFYLSKNRLKTAIFLLSSPLFLTSMSGSAQTVTLQERKMSLSEIVKLIQQQTGYDFLFDADQLRDKHVKVTKVRQLPLQEALKQIFSQTDVDYRLGDKSIVLKKRASVPPQSVQIRTYLRGLVKNSEGNLLTGATVRNVRTGDVVVVDAKGEFNCPGQLGDVLEISFLGYQKRSVSPTSDAPVQVVMVLATNELENAVVIGYGSQKKKFLTGSVGVIKGKDLEESPAVNLSNMLMGRATGLTSNMTSGAPDRDRATIKIRGMGEALIVIDGVAREGQGLIGMEMDKLDPSMIESITVLKDADAAVYGTRGANGVIVITTKKGNREKPSLSYSSQLGWQSSTRLPRFLDSYQYALLNNEMYTNDIAEKGSSPRSKYSDAELQKFLDGSDQNRYPNTNWYDQVLRKSAFVQRHNVSVSGGSDKSRYFIGGNLTDQAGLMKTSGFKRYGLVSNTSYDVTPTTTVSVSLNYINEIADNPAAYAETIFSRLASLPAVSPARYTNGLYAYSGFSGNPMTDVLSESGYNKTTRNVFTGAFGLTQKIAFVDGLVASGQVTIDRNSSFQKSFTIPFPQYTLAQGVDDYTLQNGTEKPYLSESYNQNNNTNIQLKLSYIKQFGKHNIDAMALYEQNEFSSEVLSADRSNFPVASLDQLFLGDANTQKNLGSSTENARQSLVGRLIYNYAGKYILQGSFRADGSPYYPKEKRNGFFPAVSGAWIISEEPFIKHRFQFVDQLKLRSSYGRLGNDGGNLYTYFYNYAVVPAGYVFGTSDNIQPLTRISNLTVPNTNITWEKVDAFDIGLDATLWKGKLGFEFDYYNKNKFDILRSRAYDVPLSFGLSPALQNFARERYYGYELALSTNNQWGGWKFNARLNMTYSKSNVVDYGEGDAVLPGLRQEGSPIGMVRILEADGIFRDEADVANWAQYKSSPNGTPFSAKPGDIRYKDQNNDGIVELYSGSPDRAFEARYIYPPTVYGLNLSTSWNGWRADAFLQASTDVFINYTAANDIANFYELHLDRWTPDNLDASYPRLLSNHENNRLPSTFYVKNGNYLKLRTAQISYEFPKELVRALRISSLGLSFQGQNLFTISKNRRFDPESTGATANLYPPQRIFSFGVRVGL